MHPRLVAQYEETADTLRVAWTSFVPTHFILRCLGDYAVTCYMCAKPTTIPWAAFNPRNGIYSHRVAKACPECAKHISKMWQVMGVDIDHSNVVGIVADLGEYGQVLLPGR